VRRAAWEDPHETYFINTLKQHGRGSVWKFGRIFVFPVSNLNCESMPSCPLLSDPQTYTSVKSAISAVLNYLLPLKLVVLFAD
jgi:hypothetical protein